MTLIEQARAIYVQYMRRSIAAQGAECSEDAITEVIDGKHDEKHGVQIALLTLETQAAEIARLRGLLGEAEGALVEAIIGVGDDYMTSEAHHPDYVLIPVAKFDQLVAAEEALKRGTALAKLRAEKEDG